MNIYSGITNVYEINKGSRKYMLHILSTTFLINNI